MQRNLTGLKIRALRKQAGLTQNALARDAGISASYLNLIEGNKRPVGRDLLDRLSTLLGAEPAELRGLAERRIVESLDEVAADPAATGGAVRPETTEDLVGRFPAWSSLILKLYREFRDQQQAVMALADRLNRDPFLGESVHTILTSATAISSAAEILAEEGQLSPADRARFLSIIESDGERLSATAQSLLEFFQNANMRVRSATAMEHVDAFIFAADNYFPELEDIAAAFVGKSPARPSETQPPVNGEAPESARFAAIRQAAGPLAVDAIHRQIADAPDLATEESRALAASALSNYVAGAILLPYERFLEAAEKCRYDVDVLARRFGVSYEQAAHRLATLRRPDAPGVRFAYMRSDASGYVTKRLPLAGLPLPRYGTACPLWVVYGAFQTPGATARNFGQLPSGDSFLFFARAIEKNPGRIGHPRKLLSIMLACSAFEADRVVYAHGIDAATATVPVGTVCRLCPRAACAHRQEAPLIG